jgi:hypothetical protein
MTLFEVAKAIARADAAMIRAGVPLEQRRRALDDLSDQMVREGLEVVPPPARLREYAGSHPGNSR